MGSGGKYREVGRRAVLASTVPTAVGTTGCLSSVENPLAADSYDTVGIDVRATGVVWSGTVAFEDADGGRVAIPVERALGSQTYVLPDDIDADDYDVIYAPITIDVAPKRGVDETNPLAVVVRCDGAQCGSASTTTVDDSIRVEVP